MIALNLTKLSGRRGANIPAGKTDSAATTPA